MAIPDSAVSLILHLPARHSHLPIKSPFPHLTLGLPNTSSHCMQLVHPVTKCRCCMASNGNSKHARPTQHRPARARVLSKTLLILHTLLHCGFPFRTYVRTMCSTTNHTCLRVGHRIHCRSKVGFKIITSSTLQLDHLLRWFQFPSLPYIVVLLSLLHTTANSVGACKDACVLERYSPGSRPVDGVTCLDHRANTI